MKTIHRKILFITFVLAFLIITPLVSLYATGYKLGNGFNIEKTGILIMDTEPKGAKIYLNDKVQTTFLKKIIAQSGNFITTPAKIKNLLPGEYNVRVELPGYWTWQKKLTIKPGESTFAEDINLFKKNTPLLLIGGSYDEILLPKNKNFLFASNEKEAIQFNLSNEDIKSFSTASGTSLYFDSVLWSPKEESLITRNLIFNTNDWVNPISSALIAGEGTDIKWKNDTSIYYLNNSNLYLHNLKSDVNESIVNDQKIVTYLPKGNAIYFTSEDEESTYLNSFEIDTKKIKGIVKLQKGNYEFINPENRIINLRDKSTDNLHLIDPAISLKPLRQTIENVKKTHWIDENKLLFANNFEIWIFDLSSLNASLITRISNKIDEIIWHPSNNYIIYSTDKNINVLELDNREKYNITKIIELNTIKNLKINTKGDILYFLSEIGNQKGVFKLMI